MDIKTPKFAIVAILTFIILFLMNYLGNTADDKLYRALLTAAAGVAGLTMGMWFVHKNKGGDFPEKFD